MKIQKQAVAGLVLGAVIAAGITVLVPKQITAFYSSSKIDGNTLKSMYNGSFKSMTLNFKYSSTTKSFDLIPAATNPDGNSIVVDQRLLTVQPTGKKIAGDKTLVPYTLEHNRVSGLLQLQTLVSIVNNNPGCYFILNADDYSTVDPTDHTHICYRIMAYTSAGRLIDVSAIDRGAFLLNPNPPGHPY